MRKSTKNTVVNRITTPLQNYHEGGGNYDGSYAFDGFVENKYFTSDRTIKLNSSFERADGKPLKGFGLEIEMESNLTMSSEHNAVMCRDYLATSLPKELFKYQRDGSLNYGVEAITQPMTKEFIRNNYPNFRIMWQKMDVLGLRPGDHCGMHVNMSNALFGKDTLTQIDNIKKFTYFINATNNYKLCCKLLNRSYSRIGFCEQMGRYETKEGAQNADTSMWVETRTNHGVSMNLAHFEKGRVELRLVGPQPKYANFRNTMEVIFHLIDRINSISWNKIDDLYEVFKGCNQYVVDRLYDCYTDGLITSDLYSKINDAKIEVDFGRN